MFLIAGVLMQIRGTMSMEKLGGLYKEYPKISLLIAIVLFSLVGIPPLSGFWPKIYLFKASFTNHYYIFVAALIIGSFVTLYVISKLWAEVFWKETPANSTIDNKFEPLPLFRKILLILPIGILGTVSVYIGLDAENIIRTAGRISHELIDTSSYIQAVLKK